MTIGNLKPKQLQSQSETQANYHFSQPWADGIHGISCSFLQISEEQKENQLGRRLWKRDGVTQSQLDLLVKPTPILCWFLIGRLITHHFFEPISKQTKPKQSRDCFRQSLTDLKTAVFTCWENSHVRDVLFSLPRCSLQFIHFEISPFGTWNRHVKYLRRLSSARSIVSLRQRYFVS